MCDWWVFHKWRASDTFSFPTPLLLIFSILWSLETTYITLFMNLTKMKYRLQVDIVSLHPLWGIFPMTTFHSTSKKIRHGIPMCIQMGMDLFEVNGWVEGIRKWILHYCKHCIAMAKGLIVMVGHNYAN